MKVELKIENDSELREYIKDCIKGQVLSIVRSDFKEMVIEELSRKIKGVSGYNFDRMQKEATIEAVKIILCENDNVSMYKNDFIKPYVERIVEEAMIGKDWNTIVDQVAKEKLKGLIGLK